MGQETCLTSKIQKRGRGKNSKRSGKRVGLSRKRGAKVPPSLCVSILPLPAAEFVFSYVASFGKQEKLGLNRQKFSLSPCLSRETRERELGFQLHVCVVHLLPPSYWLCPSFAVLSPFSLSLSFFLSLSPPSQVRGRVHTKRGTIFMIHVT